LKRRWAGVVVLVLGGGLWFVVVGLGGGGSPSPTPTFETKFLPLEARQTI